MTGTQPLVRAEYSAQYLTAFAAVITSFGIQASTRRTAIVGQRTIDIRGENTTAKNQDHESNQNQDIHHCSLSMP